MLHVAEIDSCFIIILLVFCSMIIAFDCKVKLLMFLLVDNHIHLNIRAILLTRVPVLVPLLPPMFGYLPMWVSFLLG